MLDASRVPSGERQMFRVDKTTLRLLLRSEVQSVTRPV